MEKPFYNQGDLIQYRDSRGDLEVGVITEVFTLPDDASLYYRVMWLGDEEPGDMVYHFSHLDNSTMYSTVMRGQ